MNSKHLDNDYEFFTLAGASLGVMQTKYPEWKNTFKNQLDLAIKLHKIDEIWIFDHMDCGMYKNIYNLHHDDNIDLHVNNLNLLKNELSKMYPKITCKGHVIKMDGIVQEIG